jgi:shikimate dehydrogenase
LEISANTRLLGILGDPVAHSLSPTMQNAAFRALGLDAVYLAWQVPAHDLAAVLDGFARAGTAGNVTVPHKEPVADQLGRRTELCERTGACNTFWVEKGTLVGDNTDVSGILHGLKTIGADGSGRWLVIGTGGAARAAVIAAAQVRASILVRSREPARSELFTEWARGRGVTAERAGDVVEADVVINASVLGLRAADPSPFPPDHLRGVRAALDCVYAPGETAWVRAARAAGLAAADGREILVEQGARALERWFPDTRAPREIMRAAVVHALNGAGSPGA